MRIYFAFQPDSLARCFEKQFETWLGLEFSVIPFTKETEER
jgi:hypothetical protein